MKKFKWVTAMSVLVSTSVAVIAVGSGPAIAESGPGSSFTLDPAANFAAFVVSEELTPSLARETNFVGQEVTSAGLEITVSSAPTAAETALVAAEATAQLATMAKYSIDPAPSSVPITFRVVPNSLAALIALTQRLDAAANEWAARGMALSSWGPDVTTGRVVVHLQKYTTAASGALEAAYGDALTVETVDETAASSTRTADTAPWYGGDKIDQGSTYCTSWFSTISAAGAAVTPTAGHCGAGTWTQNGHTFGTVTSRYFGGSMDGELIPVSGNSAIVWSDPTSTTRAIIGLAVGDTVGVLTCTDGATDREKCSVRIDATGQSVNYDGQTITGLVKAHQTGGSAAFSGGDSGGPVETTSGSTQAVAQGMIEARVTTDASQGWYMPARTVDSYFNVFVKTS